MRPWEHVLVAVLPVVAYSLVRHRRLPGGAMVFVVFFASLYPDLVDKPLAWTFGVIPSGRMLAHSLVVAAPTIVAVLLVASWLGYLPYGVGFAWGYVSHLAADFYPVVSQGTNYYYFPNMFWPLLEANPDRSTGFGHHAPDLPLLALELSVFALVSGYVLVTYWRVQRANPA